LIERATRSPQSRSKLVASIAEKLLLAEMVAKLFHSEIAFDEAEISQLSDLFSDANPAYRLAALRLINPQRMLNALLGTKLKSLLADAHAEVGRTARTLWDTLKTDGVID
jgi:hypothetical protein